MFFRAYVVLRLLSATLVNAPPTTIVSPTTAMVQTVPSRTFGVQSTGLAETIVGWARSASAGGAQATAAATITAAASRRRRMRATPGGMIDELSIAPTSHARCRKRLLHAVDHEVGRSLQIVPERRPVRFRQ